MLAREAILSPCNPECECHKAELKQRGLLEALEGGWFRKKDGKPVGELVEGRLIWNRIWGFDEAYLSIYEDDSRTLSMYMQGSRFIGRVSFEAQATIVWSDGDVWIRK